MGVRLRDALVHDDDHSPLPPHIPPAGKRDVVIEMAQRTSFFSEEIGEIVADAGYGQYMKSTLLLGGVITAGRCPSLSEKLSKWSGSGQFVGHPTVGRQHP